MINSRFSTAFSILLLISILISLNIVWANSVKYFCKNKYTGNKRFFIGDYYICIDPKILGWEYSYCPWSDFKKIKGRWDKNYFVISEMGYMKKLKNICYINEIVRPHGGIFYPGDYNFSYYKNGKMVVISD